MEKQLSERTNGGTNDFESLMEQSLRAPRPGDVLSGTVLLITRDNVIIDINYKCEGQVPLARGEVAVEIGKHRVLIGRPRPGAESNRRTNCIPRSV